MTTICLKINSCDVNTLSFKEVSQGSSKVEEKDLAPSQYRFYLFHVKVQRQALSNAQQQHTFKNKDLHSLKEGKAIRYFFNRVKVQEAQSSITAQGTQKRHGPHGHMGMRKITELLCTRMSQSSTPIQIKLKQLKKGLRHRNIRVTRVTPTALRTKVLVPLLASWQPLTQPNTC